MPQPQSEMSYPAWTERNPDGAVVNTLANVAGAMIVLWSIGILWFLIAASRMPAVY